MNETQHWIRIREPVKSAARTDTVTGIRLNWCGMIDDQMQRRKNRRMRPVTQIAMRRAYRQPRHHHAKQPGSYAGCGFDGRLHSRIILPQGIAEVIRGRSEIRFRSPDDGLSGIYRARGPTWIANGVVAVSFNEAKYAAFFSIARQPEPPARSSQSNARFRAIAFAQPNAPDPCGCAPYAREDPEIS
jgi:hypothetical protein